MQITLKQLQKFTVKILSMELILNWKNIYIFLRCIVTADIRLWIVQYKSINKVLYLNKMLFKFGKIFSSLCSFRKTNDAIPVRLFFECTQTNYLLNEIQPFCPNALFSNPSTTKSPIMGISNLSENSLLMNHLLVIFKYYPYNAREDANLSNELLNCLYLRN